MTIKNSARGKVFYGMHFYPGVATTNEKIKIGSEERAARVFVNEDTIRAMDESFRGCPVYVLHADEPPPDDIDEVKKDADGWVVESFYNAADGRHWAKFIICSDKAEAAIERGWKLSNCYQGNRFEKGGEYTGIRYDKEVKGGAYEHLAIVPNPRYDDSIILSPEDFRVYNENLHLELQRLANSKEGENVSILKVFKREQKEATVDLENTHLVLPKSKKEVSLMRCVNAMDEACMSEGKALMANGDHMVEYGGHQMTVNAMKERLSSADAELTTLKKDKMGEETTHNEDDEDAGVAEEVEPEEVDNAADDDDSTENDDGDYAAADEPAQIAGVNSKQKNSKDATARTKNDAGKKPAAKTPAEKAKAAEKARRLANANAGGGDFASFPMINAETSADMVARGKARYGS